MLPGLMQFGLNPFFQAAAAYGADLDATAGKPDANQVKLYYYTLVTNCMIQQLLSITN
jgi:hypothetical protein